MKFWFLAALMLIPLSAVAQERIDLSTRPGVSDPVYATFVPGASASLILFPGRFGVYSASRNNFLVRIAPDLVRQGFNVLIPDVPSDEKGGLTRAFRTGAEHARDIEAIVALAHSRSPAPVWLIGTSNGSISAGNGAAILGRRIAGVVLSSSVWAQGMAAIPAERIIVPVLVIHNRDDACDLSPIAGVDAFMARLTAAPARQFIAVSGGLSRSSACQALSPHGYYGIENTVVPAMVDWIRTH